MMGKTHVVGGLAAGAAFVVLRDLPLPAALYTMGASAIGGLLPDIDHRNSTISQKVKPVGFVVNKLAGHRGVFHDPTLYLALFALAFYFARHWIGWLPPLFIGIGSHLLLDALNPQGIPILKRVTGFQLRLLKIPTGGIGEKVIKALLVIVSVSLIGYYSLGIANMI